MATPPPDGPSSRPIISSTRGGLSSPQLKVAVSSDSHSPLSEAAHVPTDPALCQDISLSDSQHDLFAAKTEFDAYSEPFDFDHPDFLEDFEPYRDTVLEQAWVNDFPASLGGLSHSLAQFGATKRAISSSSPSGFSHKRRKDDHKSPWPPYGDQQAPPGHDQPAQRLTTTLKPLEAMYKAVQSPKLPSITSAMAEEVQKSKRSFACAFREAQSKLGLPYTCTAAPVSTVSAGRTHMTRKLPRGQPPHLSFLRLCKTCNEDILDEHEFDTFHGADGLKCDHPKAQRKGDAGQQEQYDILCSKVMAYILQQGNLGETTTCTTAGNDSSLMRPAPPTSDSVLLPQLSEPTQDRDGAAKERSRQLPISKHPQKPCMAREN
ncbi:hypothetical protein BKA58DRAFT_171707 [Alternaria rosae]|uniref:uncharacterized protein n=1 Tax=Alternaria rosae TaxID=1187941 RepID=UPI001E8D82DD|nr:uncharacterized protein BKA58DRAFT_171707 [Alternaria rosae]KAH6870129.1 hypothetical protein BKA58DRAFT_171707 [Alternaria rosae]